MACALLCFVWGMSLVVCSPPWFVDEWAIHIQHDKPIGTPILAGRGGKRAKSVPLMDSTVPASNQGYQCAYPMSGKFFIFIQF
jgi:hypothetical protein